MPDLNVAVFVSGRGSNLAALLDAKAKGRLTRVRFAAVFSDVDDPPAFDHARRHDVPVFHVAPGAFSKKADFEAAVVSRLKEFRADFIVLAGYMRIVGPTLLSAYPWRVMNIHPSLLPAFPGLHAQEQAFDYGVKVSGCTVHFVDQGTDTGPVILQRTVACLPDDTVAALSARILEQEHLALPEALELAAAGRLRVEGRKVLILP